MDPPANNHDLHWFPYFEENPPLPWDDQTMELDQYLEMLDHHNYLNHDQLGIQDFDPFDDLSLWGNWCDDNGLPFFSGNHDCNVTSDEPKLSSASAADHCGRKRGRWDDDGLAPFLSCNDNRSYVSGDEDNTTVTAADHGGWKLWDDSLPLLSSIVDEDTSGDLIKPIDHDCQYVTSHEAPNSAAVDGGRRAGRRPVPPLELEEIEKLFEMPIVMAAKELNVGLTVLKKRCRELNIKRWPHRKLKSLKSLIQNVKEMGLKEEMEMLEENKRMMEKVPEMELTQRTKKLRQACFKFNYKKRRLLIPNHESPHYPYPFNHL